MIPKERKDKIAQYYSNLRVKSVSKTANKFNITRNSVYSVLDEFGISKPSEIRDNENDDNVMELIREYLEAENKTIGMIETIANKYDMTTKELYEVFKKYNVPAPKMLTRIDAIEWTKKEANIKQISNEIENDTDSEMYSAVSVMKQYKDMGWDKKEGSEKARALDYYIKTRYKIDSFSIYVKLMERIIQDEGVYSLEKYLKAIRGNLSITSESIESKINNTLLKITEEMIQDLSKPPEPEKPQEKPPQTNFFSKELIETYLSQKHPKYYGVLMNQKKREKQQKSLDLIKNVIGKPKPKPREKRVIITGDDVAQYLMREE